MKYELMEVIARRKHSPSWYDCCDELIGTVFHVRKKANGRNYRLLENDHNRQVFERILPYLRKHYDPHLTDANECFMRFGIKNNGYARIIYLNNEDALTLLNLE